MPGVKKWGFIDIECGIGGFTHAVKKYTNCDILLATATDVIQYSIYQYLHPEINSMNLRLNVAENVSHLHTKLLEIADLTTETHSIIIHIKTNTSFYHIPVHSKDQTKVFEEQMCFLGWIIRECKWLYDCGLIANWIIETEERLYSELDVKTKYYAHVQEVNQVMFGIPQNRRFLLLTSREKPIFMRPNTNQSFEKWNTLLGFTKSAIMFHPRYEYKDIIKIASKGRLEVLETRSTDELPFELHPTDQPIIAIGTDKDSTLVPLTAPQIGCLFGFPLAYLDIALFTVYEREKRTFVLQGKSPFVASRLIESIFIM